MNRPCFVVTAFAISLLTACLGCKTVTASYDPGVPSVPTLPCPVALSLSKEFTSYVCVNSEVVGTGEVIKVPFGPDLQKYAKYVAQSVFGDVQVLDGEPPRGEAKLLLVPRVTSSRLAPPVGRVRVTAGDLGVHWDFNDPKTAQTLFSMQLQSEFSLGHIFMDARFPEVCDGLMTNLTAITLKRFNSSKELQRLSGH
jgi:hypothetical protein